MNRTGVTRVLGIVPLMMLASSTAFAWAVFLRGGFRSVLGWLALMTGVPLFAMLLLVATVIRTIATRRRVGRLVATVGIVAFCSWPAGWLFGIGPITYPYRLADASPSITVRLPTDVPMRVAWGGDDLAHNYHAAYPDQRWAYDLVVEPAMHGSRRLEEYGCFGVPVVAPAAGVVHVAHDGEPDHAPGLPSGDPKALGNHVALALPSGVFLVLAHLKRESVAVHEGEIVKVGARLGACGNSGNTSEPHVHIHAQRQDPRGRPLNFAEGLPLYFHGHDGPPMPTGGVEVMADGGVRARGAIVRHLRDAPDGT